MAKKLRVALEVGPKGKKVVAVATDWPGLERAASTGDAAIEKLQTYLPRYVKVAKLARMGPEFEDVKGVRVVEEYEGVGSTDFWGISFAFSSYDAKKMSSEDLNRELALMKASWRFFDGVRGRVSAEMAKGPRGGGRDRDVIVGHVYATEQKEFGKKVGLPRPEVTAVSDAEVKAWRDAYCKAITAYHSAGKPGRTWPLRYLIRHTAYHALDHAWEMEDKDLG